MAAIAVSKKSKNVLRKKWFELRSNLRLQLARPAKNSKLQEIMQTEALSINMACAMAFSPILAAYSLLSFRLVFLAFVADSTNI